TVPSFCLCVRTPRHILAHWTAAFGLPGVGFEDIVPYFERAEADAHVRPLTPDDVNRNNAKLKTGAERLGFRRFLPAHNRIDCLGCGYCALGCAYDRKGDALTVHLAAASRRGAIIVPDCRVMRVTVGDGRANGVVAQFHRVRDGRVFALEVRAETVVLA